MDPRPASRPSTLTHAPSDTSCVHCVAWAAAPPSPLRARRGTMPPPPLGSNTWRQSSNTCRPLCRALLAVPAGIWLGVSLFPCDRALLFTAVAMPLHCRSLMFTAFVLLCFSCASAAFVAKTLPLSCAFTAFVAKTLPLVVKLLVFLR